MSKTKKIQRDKRKDTAHGASVITDAAKLHEALALVSAAFAQAGVAWRVRDIASLIDQELVIALQVLCNNLHELECPVPRRAYNLIEEVGRKYLVGEFPEWLGVKSADWEIIKPQVTD